MAQNKWRGVMQVEGMLDKIGIVYWMSLSTTPIHYFTWQTVQYCHKTFASEEVNVTNAVYWWVDEGTMSL